MDNLPYIFIPSYHRPNNLKTVRYYHDLGYPMGRVVVFIDSEADDKAAYEESCKAFGCELAVFDMDEARRRFDYVHRASVSRRSAGQARNMFQDYAKEKGIDFYMVSDDYTQGYDFRVFSKYIKAELKPVNLESISQCFIWMEQFMRKNKIGMFAFPQTGDFYGDVDTNIFKRKVMNTTFYLMPYVYRGERGVQDDDTSLFCGVHNEGYLTGMTNFGLCLHQTLSASAEGGLTDLYNECKLLNKSLVVPIQFPSAVYAERQKSNGNRLHHHILYKYLAPCILKNEGGRSNIAWDTYPEDVPFTNEPKRSYMLRKEEHHE